jgi:DinB superfamily
MSISNLDAASRQILIARYVAGYDAVVTALEGITAEELDGRGEGEFAHEWSARQIVHHLADSETISYVRLRKLLAENDTMIQGYDENVWATQLWYGGPLEPSLVVLKAVRESSAALLLALTDEHFKRVGSHSESGPGYTMDYWLRAYAEHPHEHAEQIGRAKRGYRP